MADALPEAAFDRRTAVFGTSGSGKTSAVKLEVERKLREGRRVIVLDPKGDWHGLRSSADGSGPGFPIPVLGGEAGDAPLPPEAGARIGELLATRDLSCVLDASAMLEEELEAFAAPFFAALLHHAPRRAVWLVVDEAHRLAAQGSGSKRGSAAQALRRLIQQGRSKGFRLVLVSQRPADLDKSSLSQCETLVAMRLALPHDIRAVGDWLGTHAEPGEARRILRTLPRLEDGEGWAWWPRGGLRERVRFPRPSTFDAGATPDADEAPRPAALATGADIDALRAALAVPAEGGVDLYGNAPAPAAARHPDPAELAQARREGFLAGIRATLAKLSDLPDIARGALDVAADQLAEGMRERLRDLERPNRWAADLADLERGAPAGPHAVPASQVDAASSPPAPARPGRGSRDARGTDAASSGAPPPPAAEAGPPSLGAAARKLLAVLVPPLRTFFAQVCDPALDEDDNPVVWVGTGYGELPDVDRLAAALLDHAVLDDATRRRLFADQETGR